MAVAALKLKEKQDLAKLRTLTNEKKQESLPLGEETLAFKPEDVKLMFASKIALEMLNQKVRVDNIKASFLKSYGEVTPKLEETLDKYS